MCAQGIVAVLAAKAAFKWLLTRCSTPTPRIAIASADKDLF